MDFVPKYHPEFNLIDMYWGYVNCKAINECDYNWKIFLDKVPEALDSVPLIFMRREFNKFCRYIYGYIVLLNTSKFELASMKYKTHHIIPEEFLKNSIKKQISNFFPNEG